jgi:hypothetical protein
MCFINDESDGERDQVFFSELGTKPQPPHRETYQLKNDSKLLAMDMMDGGDAKSKC